MIDIAGLWLKALLLPRRVGLSAAREQAPDRIKYARAWRIWAIATSISVVIQYVLVAQSGSVAFGFILWLSVCLLSAGLSLIVGAAMHASLRLFGIPSSFVTTFSVYSLVVGSYLPMMSALSCAAVRPFLSDWISIARTSGGNPSVGLDLLRITWAAPAPVGGVIVAFWSGAVAVTLALMLSAVLVETFAEAYLSDRYRVSLALTFGTSVMAVVPNTLLIAIVITIAYLAGGR